MRRSAGVLVLIVVLVGAPAGVVVAQEGGQYVRGQPDLSVYVPEPTLESGTTTQLTLQVANNGRLREGTAPQRDLVTTARGVTVEVTNDGPFEISTQRQSIGSIPDGEVRNVTLTVTVPENVDPGEYSLRLRLRYRYTSTSAPGTDGDERTRNVRTAVDTVVDDRPEFTLRTIDSDVQVGEEGTIRTAVTNTGSAPARDITLVLNSTTTDVTLGTDARTTARIERLAPGENTTVPFDARVREDVSVRNFTLAGSVHYTDRNGIEQTQTGLTTGFRPMAEQELTLAVEESTLRVGELGTIHGTITNDGPAPVESVVLSIDEDQLDTRSGTYAVGDLDPSESASFRFRGVIPADADAAPKPLDITTEYRTGSGTGRSTSSPVHVDVAERRDAIGVTPINGTFVAGETGTLELEIENRLDDSITDVRLHLVVEEPLESDFRTTFVPELAPGGTDRVSFDLEIDDEAPPSRFPATIEVEYRNPEDENTTARPSIVAVTVTDAEAVLPVTEIGAILVVVLLVGIGGWWFYGRRLV